MKIRGIGQRVYSKAFGKGRVTSKHPTLKYLYRVTFKNDISYWYTKNGLYDGFEYNLSYDEHLSTICPYNKEKQI